MTPAGGVPTDEALLQELRTVRRRAEAAPASVVAAAVAAFGWRSVAIAVAGLEFDSVLDEDDDDLARVRDGGGERRLRFASPGRALEVYVDGAGEGLLGRVDPPAAGSMVLRRPDGTTSTAPVDERGQFFFEAVGHGPVSFRPALASGAVGDFQTDWVTI